MNYLQSVLALDGVAVANPASSAPVDHHPVEQSEPLELIEGLVRQIRGSAWPGVLAHPTASKAKPARTKT